MEPFLKIFNSLKSGFFRSGKAWKSVIIVWLITLLLVSMVAMPMKSAFSAGLGNSTIYEELKNGINVEVFADLKSAAGSLGSFFSTALLMLVVVSFVVNSFITGGLFNSLRKDSGEFSAKDFFRASSEKFWSFFIISLIFSILVLILLVLVVVIPVSFIAVSEKANDVIIFNSAILLSSLFLFLVLILLISADYSRAWQVAHTENACFKAINFGFRETFRTFFTSYPAMLIIMLIQFFYMWLALKILHGIKPESGIGIIILFTASQILFILKLYLKISRFGSFTVMMESGGRNPLY